ncbi:MAG TPA: hypothetical protein VEG65_08090 [Candidatus Bathyarchaeia archaeon]|nr:hypothetical protein [Candidatus Bathyarchaeia archaeon]
MEFDCLNCCERICEEELIDGRCPICGWQHDTRSSNDYDIDPRLIALFWRFVRGLEDAFVGQAIEIGEAREGGISVKKPMNRTSHRFGLEATRFDKMRIKKCCCCGRHHLKVGATLLQVQVPGPKASYRKLYVCPPCEQSRSAGRKHRIRQIVNL